MRAAATRLTVLELHTGATAVISDGQAAEIALAVKNIGQTLAARRDKNGYAQGYSEMYRRWLVSSYKDLPVVRYQEVLDGLAGWYNDRQGGAATPLKGQEEGELLDGAALFLPGCYGWAGGIMIGKAARPPPERPAVRGAP